MKNLILAVLVSVVGAANSFAMTCSATKGGITKKSVPVDVSDLQIDLGAGKFVWIGFGQEETNVWVMRPATEAEKHVAGDPDRDPISNTALSHSTVSTKGPLNFFSVPMSGYTIRCEN